MNVYFDRRSSIGCNLEVFILQKRNGCFFFPHLSTDVLVVGTCSMWSHRHVGNRHPPTPRPENEVEFRRQTSLCLRTNRSLLSAGADMWELMSMCHFGPREKRQSLAMVTNIKLKVCTNNSKRCLFVCLFVCLLLI